MTLVLRHLDTLHSLRGNPQTDAAFAGRLSEVKRWQQQRLSRTYADLESIPRYTPAVRFFLDDLYGDKDFSRRDAEMRRILPTLVRVLPESTVEMVDLALELEALAEAFDQALTRLLPPGVLSESAYCDAFRGVGGRDRRERQVALVGEVGDRLDKVVKKPFIASTLKLLRRPAHLAGLADLQNFLERGFAAFKIMGGAEEFLATIMLRERTIMQRIFAGVRDPFALG